MNQPKIAIIIIHYNTPQYLKTCLDHVFAQTYKNIDVYFIDNNSPDKTGLKFVKKHYSIAENCNNKNIIIIPNKENLGYARAANQGIHLATDADYVVITNPDIIYSPTYFEKIIARAQKAISKENKRLAGITGKVLKYEFTFNSADSAKTSSAKDMLKNDVMQERVSQDVPKTFRSKYGYATNIIDTVGLTISKSLRVTDEGQGHEDCEKFNKEKEVFGISGACPLYSRQALEDASITLNGLKEYFDEDFFMYKEDVDLSWRMQLFGYDFIYYPKAIAFHGRGTGVIKRDTMSQIAKNRKSLSRFQRLYSFRNQNLMIVKNLLWKNYIKNFFHIFTHDAVRMLYVLFREPFLLKTIPQYAKLLPKMLKKRRLIMEKARKNKGVSRKINNFMR